MIFTSIYLPRPLLHHHHPPFFFPFCSRFSLEYPPSLVPPSHFAKLPAASWKIKEALRSLSCTISFRRKRVEKITVLFLFANEEEDLLLRGGRGGGSCEGQSAFPSERERFLGGRRRRRGVVVVAAAVGGWRERLRERLRERERERERV